MKANSNHRSGLIKLIVLMVVAILVLSYFRVDIRNFFESDLVTDNFTFIWEQIKAIFERLARPLTTRM